MKAADPISQERFLARAVLAEERAGRSQARVEKKMWEDIAHCWRELARQSAPAGSLEYDPFELHRTAAWTRR